LELSPVALEAWQIGTQIANMFPITEKRPPEELSEYMQSVSKQFILWNVRRRAFRQLGAELQREPLERARMPEELPRFEPLTIQKPQHHPGPKTRGWHSRAEIYEIMKQPYEKPPPEHWQELPTDFTLPAEAEPKDG
jgi:hypothetical protein